MTCNLAWPSHCPLGGMTLDSVSSFDRKWLRAALKKTLGFLNQCSLLDGVRNEVRWRRHFILILLVRFHASATRQLSNYGLGMADAEPSERSVVCQSSQSRSLLHKAALVLHDSMHWFLLISYVPTPVTVINMCRFSSLAGALKWVRGDYGGLRCPSEAFPLWSISPAFSMAAPSRCRRRPGPWSFWNVSSCAKHGRSVARTEFGYPIAGVAIWCVKDDSVQTVLADRSRRIWVWKRPCAFSNDIAMCIWGHMCIPKPWIFPRPRHDPPVHSRVKTGDSEHATLPSWGTDSGASPYALRAGYNHWCLRKPIIRRHRRFRGCISVQGNSRPPFKNPASQVAPVPGGVDFYENRLPPIPRWNGWSRLPYLQRLPLLSREDLMCNRRVGGIEELHATCARIDNRFSPCWSPNARDRFLGKKHASLTPSICLSVALHGSYGPCRSSVDDIIPPPTPPPLSPPSTTIWGGCSVGENRGSWCPMANQHRVDSLDLDACATSRSKSEMGHELFLDREGRSFTRTMYCSCTLGLPRLLLTQGPCLDWAKEDW